MRIIKKEVIKTQRKLSEINGNFIEFVENNPEALKASNFKSLDLNDKLFVLQPWPTFVNQTNINQFKEVSEKLFDMIISLPKRMFNNDIKKISAYYEIPGNLAMLQLEGATDEHLRNLLARGDFILSSSGLKCLEYNVSANLGGWYLPLWEALYLKTPIIAKFFKKHRVKINNQNLIQRLFEHIIHSNLNKVTENDREINSVLVTRDSSQQTISMGMYLDNLYKTVLQKNHPALKGEVFLCDFHHLDILDCYVYYKGKKIHTLIEMYNGIVSPPVLEVFKAGNIRLMNGPITSLLSSKLNLALLSDYKAANHHVFSDEEKKIIDQYIPWARKIVPGNTTYGVENLNLKNFILSNKDKFVLKPSVGHGGEGIYIGRRVSETKWEELISIALQQRNWLVQEYIHPSTGLYQAGETGCELHDMVWGFFVLGSQYAGTWVRVLPQKNNKGVINCHQGATVSAIFEVDE